MPSSIRIDTQDLSFTHRLLNAGNTGKGSTFNCSSYDAKFLQANFQPLVADQLPCVMFEKGGVDRNLLNLMARDIGSNSCGPTDCAHRQLELQVRTRCAAYTLEWC